MRLGFAPSRRAASELIADGRVRVNGRRYRKGEPIAPGDRVEVGAGPAASGVAANPDLNVAILYEDAALIVADKPALMPCHPLRAEERGAVMNAVAARYPETAQEFDRPLEGGLVHRLDNGTSGALMIARNGAALAALREALRAGRVTRNYRALVAGRLEGTIEIATPIAHHAKNPRKMVAVATAGGAARVAAGPVSWRYRSAPRPAFTRVEALSNADGFTLAKVTPRTGNRHQIRVHLASIGHPLAGDELYGGAPMAGLAAGRFWLHLAELELESPAGGRVKVTAPLARDLADTLARVQAKATGAG